MAVPIGCLQPLFRFSRKNLADWRASKPSSRRPILLLLLLVSLSVQFETTSPSPPPSAPSTTATFGSLRFLPASLFSCRYRPAGEGTWPPLRRFSTGRAPLSLLCNDRGHRSLSSTAVLVFLLSLPSLVSYASAPRE